MSLSRSQRQRIVEIARGRSDEPLRLLEGPKAIRDVIDRGIVSEIWVRSGATGGAVVEVVTAARAADIPLGEASPADFERMGKTVSPQGVFALVQDTAQPLDDVAALDGMLLWLDEVQDPGNVGAVMRIAAAFGVAGVMLGAGCADPLGVKALRASAGHALRIPFARSNSGAIATACRACGRPVWTLEAGGAEIAAVDAVPSNVVLALGSEGHGFGDEVRRVAAQSVGVAIAPDVESLNVSVAAGIAVSTLAGRLRDGAAS